MSTDTPRSAVIETRTFTVTCRRRIIDGCLVTGDKRSDRDTVRALTTAEAAFREDGWTLHTDGTASCPRCIAAWEDGYGLDKGDPDDPGPIRHEHDVAKAHAAALRAEIEGDGGLGEQLAAGGDT